MRGTSVCVEQELTLPEVTQYDSQERRWDQQIGGPIVHWHVSRPSLLLVENLVEDCGEG